MHRIKLIPLCLAALILCGCVQQNVPAPTTTTAPTSQPTDPVTEPTPPPTTQPPEPETYPAITEPVLEEIPEPMDPVTKLKCIRWVNFPQLLSLGGGRVAASRNHYNRKTGDYVNYLQIIDIYGDALLREIVIDNTMELVQQRFSDGAILSIDPKALTCHVYSDSLERTDSFSVPAAGGYFSYDRKHYYHIDGDALYRMNTDTGNRSRMKLEYDFRVESLVGIHPTENLLVARVYLSAFTDDCGLAVIDAETCKLRLLSDQLKHLWFTGDCFYATRMNSTTYGNDVYMGTLTGTEVRCLSASAIGTDQMGWSVLPGSHLLVRRFAPDEEPRNTALFDLTNNTMVDLDEYGYVDCTFGTVWLYEEQLILGFYEKGDYFYPVLLDPKAMTFTEGPVPETVQWPELVDPDVVDRYLDTIEKPAPDALQEKADAIAQAYGVTVYLGSQAKLPCQIAGKQVQTVSDKDQISAALSVLETELSKYPAGFFQGLHNSIGEGGILFCLTGTVEGEILTSGFTKLLRDYYVVGLDITDAQLTDTIHHELWHAMEMRLSTDTFDTPQWAECNPASFQYYGKYDSGYSALTKWTWSGGAGEDSHFVDSYARINAREDRARIWEAAMTGDPSGCLSATQLKNKLQIMSAALQTQFPTDSPLWEQYL